MALLDDLFVPFPCCTASQQPHEFDKAWIGRIGALRSERQLRLVDPGDIPALLSNGLLHRNATCCRSNGDDPEQHQHCDLQQQSKSTPKLWIETASPLARHPILAYRVALHRRGKTCALRLDWKLTIRPPSSILP